MSIKQIIPATARKKVVSKKKADASKKRIQNAVAVFEKMPKKKRIPPVPGGLTPARGAKQITFIRQQNYDNSKIVPTGTPVIVDNPLNAAEKIYVDTRQDGMKQAEDNNLSVVMNPVVATKLEFENWPEDAQREEYGRFMQKVKTYVDYWPASLEWPSFEDYLDKDVRIAAAAELNNWIANPVDPAKVNTMKTPAHVFDLRKSAKLTLTEEKEQVNHPDHYGGDVWHEPIKVIKAWDLNFNTGSSVKYIARHGKKKPGIEGKIQDLKKARFYLDDEIKHLESLLPKKD